MVYVQPPPGTSSGYGFSAGNSSYGLQQGASRNGSGFQQHERTGPKDYSRAKCYQCNGYGHLKRDCPQLNTQCHSGPATGDPNAGYTAPVHVQTVSVTRCPVYLVLYYRDQPWTCLLDTGCDHSIIPASLVKDMKIEQTNLRTYAANGSAILIYGEAEVTLRLGDLLLLTRVIVSPHVLEPMLGSDWLKRHACRWDFERDILSLQDQDFTVTRREADSNYRRLVVQEDVAIPPRCQMTATATVRVAEFRRSPSTCWSTEPTECRPRVCAEESWSHWAIPMSP